jgi:excisionase family DNA binding protein
MTKGSAGVDPRQVSDQGKPNKRFFTVAEAATLLGLSEPTLYRAIRAGEFPAIKVRGRYVVPAKAIDEMEASAMAAAAAERTAWSVA